MLPAPRYDTSRPRKDPNPAPTRTSMIRLAISVGLVTAYRRPLPVYNETSAIRSDCDREWPRRLLRCDSRRPIRTQDGAHRKAAADWAGRVCWWDAFRRRRCCTRPMCGSTSCTPRKTASRARIRGSIIPRSSTARTASSPSIPRASRCCSKNKVEWIKGYATLKGGGQSKCRSDNGARRRWRRRTSSSPRARKRACCRGCSRTRS